MKDDYILIVDDELPIREMIHTSLDMAGFQCLQAEDAKQAHQIIVDQRPALILLDWMLPGGVSGVDLCRRLKRDENLAEIPVIMLTARGEEDHKVQGLDAGADDYLGKPFDFKEFLARIKALLKRSSQTQLDAQVLKFADLEMDLISKLVTRSGQSINLTSKEFQLLEYFLRNQEMVISKAQIAENIWEVEDENSSNLIEVYVNYLRKKVDKGFASKLIHTQFGRGYILKNE